MFAQVYSGGIHGVEGFLVSVEADVSDGLPGFYITGQPSSEVRESQDRVRTAMKNSGFRLIAKKITVNLSPAGIRKGGTAFDLPMAVAVLGGFSLADTSQLKESMIIGELGLDGQVKPVSGVLPLVIEAKRCGLKRCFLPKENVREGRVVEGIQIIGVETLEQMVGMLQNPKQLDLYKDEDTCTFQETKEDYDVDFSEIRGQLAARRAAEVASAGMHGLLLNGSAGTGKTMIARRLPTILPSLTREEDIEISKVYSICGLLPKGKPLLSKRPFRSPHHTISPQGLTGGGTVPHPGELSLASGGVLFLDELPLFSRSTLEALRQPLEERRVTVGRVAGSYEFPADFMIVAALNPCPCGFFPDRSKCRCSEQQVRTYLNRISRPILDRFDICVEISPVAFEQLGQEAKKGESSADIRERIEKARAIQQNRFQGTKIRFNSRMGEREIKQYCNLGKKEMAFASRVYKARNLSVRGYYKVLKVSRTIADLEGQEQIKTEHLAEAFGYRTLEETLWGQK